MMEWLATGGLTLMLLPLGWLLRAWLGLDDAELAVGFVMFHAAHALNDPHFAVTYLLFYRDAKARLLDHATSRAQRLRYVLAGLIVPLLLIGWAMFAVISRSAQTLGWMVQLMLLLVGWHYAKQGFGVLTVLSARRGVRFDARERTLILAHCYAAWAFAWASPARAAGAFEEKGVVYWSPARPAWVEHVTAFLLALSTVAFLIVLVRKWRREGRIALTPLISFVITIWLWTIYTSIDPLLRYVIPALHSLQYLYFVWLLGRNHALAHEGPPHFGPPVGTRLGMLALSAALLGALMFRVGPSALDASLVGTTSATIATDLGETPYFAAIFVIINIHHYFMDNVIWRRDNPQTRYLFDAP